MNPVAVNYVDKVLGRVERMMNGEELGAMIESELEDLDIDLSFENRR